MAAFNSSFFLSLLVLISAFMAAPSSVEAQIPFLNNILRLNGTVPCALNGTGSSLPPFSNATVEMRCGNTTLANTTTNAAGTFGLLVGLAQNLLMPFLAPPQQCQVVIPTPLSRCNPTLPPVGNLAANITRIVTDFVNGVNFINPVLSSFQLLPN